MEVERHGPGPQIRHGMLLPKQISPVKAKKSVSVAAIFKQKPQKIKDDSVKSKRTINDSRAAGSNAADDKAPHFKSRSSSRTPRKAGSRATKKSNMHPLAVTFKSTFRAVNFARLRN
jgi:hypothetical protein